MPWFLDGPRHFSCAVWSRQTARGGVRGGSAGESSSGRNERFGASFGRPYPIDPPNWIRFGNRRNWIQIWIRKNAINPCDLWRFVVGMAGFEPTTSCTPSKRASQAALHPVSGIRQGGRDGFSGIYCSPRVLSQQARQFSSLGWGKTRRSCCRGTGGQQLPGGAGETLVSCGLTGNRWYWSRV
jgi:hypothetical protein